ncbi:hypothetical protein AURDEDRAFT_177413 [Auricularia subglabra TFB-10046 SS5]|uniref:Uncharacterized protein n=1 Tax=Auricularia subglabra (strain TFB-10046 / SS5) TaxID=717982 RepID=J0WNT7_AURST|nr:hypothetical protein AURDEDRAFT_177413 [Auricularia subglabra TFB-10046 SS5]
MTRNHPKKYRKTIARMTTGGVPPGIHGVAFLINRRRARLAQWLGRNNVLTRSEHRQLEADYAQLSGSGYEYNTQINRFVHPLW